jgi:hypothetical protein
MRQKVGRRHIVMVQTGQRGRETGLIELTIKVLNSDSLLLMPRACQRGEAQGVNWFQKTIDAQRLSV